MAVQAVWILSFALIATGVLELAYASQEGRRMNRDHIEGKRKEPAGTLRDK